MTNIIASCLVVQMQRTIYVQMLSSYYSKGRKPNNPLKITFL